MDDIRKKIGLYVHIPFCIRKCLYCDFLSFAADDSVKESYIKALDRDLKYTFEKEKLDGSDIDTVFIGGGTPSALPEALLEQLCQSLSAIVPFSKDMEITMECNPGTVNEEKLRILKAYGINRLSFGLQSSINKELELLGRIHGYEDFVENYELARKLGFTNINIDVMAALPNQTKESYLKTLKTVTDLQPEHISSYSLIIEEGTPFYDLYGKEDEQRRQGNNTILLPSEEEERWMYEETNRYLESCGYFRYEISNFAKPGYESRHNSGYWTGKEYIGVGLGASSYINGKRFHKTDVLEEYLNSEYSYFEIEHLTEQMKMEEFMFLGLRMLKGISIREFRKRFRKDIYEVYGTQIKNLLREKLLMTTDEDTLCLTRRGLDVSNYVFEQFLL